MARHRVERSRVGAAVIRASDPRRHGGAARRRGTNARAEDVFRGTSVSLPDSFPDHIFVSLALERFADLPLQTSVSRVPRLSIIPGAVHVVCNIASIIAAVG